MPVDFTLDEDGFLQWSPKAEVSLSQTEAQIVAAAEMAQALRFIGEALHEAADAMTGKRNRPPRLFEPV